MTRRDPSPARETWPVRVYRLGEEPGEDLSATTTVEQRLAMVDVLSQRMWELSGQPVPAYTRPSIPGRVLRSA
jgi:hypothetical protein